MTKKRVMLQDNNNPNWKLGVTVIKYLCGDGCLVQENILFSF